MKFNKRVVAILIALMLIVPSVGFAAGNAASNTGNAIHIEKNKNYDKNIFLEGIQGIKNKGNINGNVITYSSSIKNSGAIKGNIIAAGSKFNNTGSVSKNLVGLYTNLMQNNAKIGKDVIAFGDVYDSNVNTVIKGDFNAFYSTVFLKGKVGGDAFIIGDKVTVNGKVDGNVQVACNELVIGSDALITGDLTYDSSEPIIIKDKNVIKGELKNKNIGIDVSIFTSNDTKNTYGIAEYYTVLSKISCLIIALIFFHFFPISALKVDLFTRRNVRKCLRMGAVVALLVIPTTLVLAVTIIGIPAAIHLLCLFYDLMYISFIPTAVAVGGLLMPGKEISYKMLAGTFVLILVDILPVGFITNILVMIANLIGFGSIIMLIKLYFEYKIKRERTEFLTLNSIRSSKDDLMIAKQKFERIKKERFDQAMKDRVKSKEELEDMIKRINDEEVIDDENNDIEEDENE